MKIKKIVAGMVAGVMAASMMSIGASATAPSDVNYHFFSLSGGGDTASYGADNSAFYVHTHAHLTVGGACESLSGTGFQIKGSAYDPTIYNGPNRPYGNWATVVTTDVENIGTILEETGISSHANQGAKAKLDLTLYGTEQNNYAHAYVAAY